MRAYNSLATTDSILGRKWVTSVGTDVYLPVASGTVTVHGPSGHVMTPSDTGAGTFAAPAGFDGTLSRHAERTYELALPFEGDVLRFDASGALTGVTDSLQRAFTVQNTSAARKTVLSSYETADGRRIDVSYTGDSRIREIDDPSSAHRYYTYGSGRLTSYFAPAVTATHAYDAGGFLTSAAYLDGRSYTAVPLSDGRTQSLTAHASGTADQTWTFAYHSNYTVVTLPKRREAQVSIRRRRAGHPNVRRRGHHGAVGGDRTGCHVRPGQPHDGRELGRCERDEPDGSPGIGVESYSYRYERGTSGWSAWSSTDTTAFTPDPSFEGESISVELRTADYVGNESGVTSQTLTAQAAPFRPAYRETALWIRATTLHDHLLEYDLARRVTRISPRFVRPGDIVFYNLEGLTPECDPQIVSRVTRTKIWVVQHTLKYVFDHRIGGQPGVDFRVEVLHPIHEIADIPHP